MFKTQKYKKSWSDGFSNIELLLMLGITIVLTILESFIWGPFPDFVATVGILSIFNFLVGVFIVFCFQLFFPSKFDFKESTPVNSFILMIVGIVILIIVVFGILIILLSYQSSTI